MSTPNERAAEAADAMMQAMNEMGFDNEAFATHILREHRTLQQTAMGAFLETIKQWAGLPENRFDARNAWTVATAKLIVMAVGKHNLKGPFL